MNGLVSTSAYRRFVYIVRLSLPKWYALALPPFVIVARMEHLPWLSVALEAALLACLNAIVDLVNRATDRVEDAIDYPTRYAMYEFVGHRRIRSAISALVVVYLSLAVVVVVVDHPSPIAAAIWCVAPVSAYLYSAGPRVKARSILSAVVVAGYPTYFLLFASLQNGQWHWPVKLAPAAFLLWVFGISLAGGKDLPNLAGDFAIGYESVVVRLSRTTRPGIVLFAVLAIPFALAVLLAVAGAPDAHRLWWSIAVLPLVVAYGIALGRATRQTELSAVRELYNICVLGFEYLVVIALEPAESTLVVVLLGCAWWVLASRFLNCDGPLTWDTVRTALDLLRRGGDIHLRWAGHRGSESLGYESDGYGVRGIPLSADDGTD